MAENKHAQTVEDIVDSLDTLEDVLAPILDKPLPETLAKLDPLDRAKMNATLAYVTQDLIFMYLKTRGIDPTKHDVMKQMTEVGKYFDKIKESENPARRARPVDQAAAKRFITAAVKSINFTNDVPHGDGLGDRVEGQGQPAHLKVTGKMIERKQAEDKPVSSDEEDEDLEMIEGDKAQAQTYMLPEPSASKPTALRRPKIDPFAGYD